VTLLHVALLGIIQGLTEFLPVSSSAHLIIARALFGWNSDALGLAFDVACHVGTLGAVVVYFWRELLGMLKAIPTLVSFRPSDPARLAVRLVVGSIPVGIAGLLVGNAVEERLRTPAVAAAFLVVVALVFLIVERVASPRRVQGSLGIGEAFVVGCAQTLALVPGVSRSGSTIAAGMILGLKREEAARFTFLLGIPAIAAAAVHEGIDVLGHPFAPGEARSFAVGMGVSGVVGYFAVKYFVRYVSNHSLDLFAWYRLGLAGVVVLWWFVR
jgi:undecaprenyl-diphosphatase